MFGLFLFATNFFSYDTQGRLSCTVPISIASSQNNDTVEQYIWRTVTPDNKSAYTQLVQNEHYMSSLGDSPKSHEEVEKYWARYMTRVNANNPMAALALTGPTGAICGFFVIGGSTTGEAGVGELVYYLNEESQGHGITSASIHPLLRLAMEIRRRGTNGEANFQCFSGFGENEARSPEDKILKALYFTTHVGNSRARSLILKKMEELLIERSLSEVKILAPTTTHNSVGRPLPERLRYRATLAS